MYTCHYELYEKKVTGHMFCLYWVNCRISEFSANTCSSTAAVQRPEIYVRQNTVKYIT